MTKVTDPTVLAQLNAPRAEPVTDPALLAQLNGTAPSGGTVDAPSGVNAPGWLQALAHVIKAPGEALRGQAVGIQQLIQHPTEPGVALAMAALAQRSNYKPQGVGENLATFASGFNDPVNKVMGGMFPGGSMVKSILGGGASSAITNGLDQAANTGKIDLGQTLQAGEEGAATGGAIHGVTAGIRSGANKLVKSSPAVFKTLAGIPETLTEYFKKNPDVMKDALPTEQARQELIDTKAGDVGQGVKDLYNQADQYWKAAATKAGVRQTAAERSQLRPIPANRIATNIDVLKPVVSNAGRLDETSQRNALKALLHIRQSIDHYNGTGVDITGKPLMNAAKSGLSELRKDVNLMIEQIPGGEIIRDADTTAAPMYDLVDKLADKFKRPGEASEWLRKTLAQEGPNAKEDMQNLLALEKVSGKPLIHDLTDAATKAAFAPKLADNQIKRSLAGASPFLISALLRTVGVPFQFSLPISATIASGGQSPAALGGALRWAQNAEPSIQKVAKGSAVAGLNAIRQLMGANQ